RIVSESELAPNACASTSRFASPVRFGVVETRRKLGHASDSAAVVIFAARREQRVSRSAAHAPAMYGASGPLGFRGDASALGL
ncbi:Protein of unknown function, partial [Gryllus bimaculatus]